MLQKLFLLIIIIWIISPTQSAVLECSWDPEMNFCSAYNITPVTQPNEVITINGKPSNYVNLNTTRAWFSNQILNYVPSGLFTLFPNLQMLGIDGNQLTSLITDSIPNCRMLSIFTLERCLSTHIPAGILQSCKSLTYLTIEKTNVTTVDVDTLRGLTNLTTLSFKYGKISCIPPGFFKYNPVLTQINLSNNLIKAIDSKLFADLPIVQGISLSHNLLTYLPFFNFSYSTEPSRFLHIDIYSNPVHAITPDFCSIFDAKPESVFLVYVFDYSCLPMTSLTLYTSTCKSHEAELQNCFANWTSSMNTPVTCGVQTTTTVPSTTAVVTTTQCPADKISRYIRDQYNRYKQLIKKIL